MRQGHCWTPLAIGRLVYGLLLGHGFSLRLGLTEHPNLTTTIRHELADSRARRGTILPMKRRAQDEDLPVSGKFMGTCALCKLKYPIAEMAAHVVICERRPAGKAESLHIAVRSPERPEFWMIVETQDKTTLYDLDTFLRKSWLECCGHLSAFKIGKQTYTDSDAEFGTADDPLDLNVRLPEVLNPRRKFEYEYDFGSTTDLVLEVLRRSTCKSFTKRVRLLALNNPPTPSCEECGKPATGLCAYCNGMPICRACVKKHECGDDAICPIVNSPRAGVCGYTGPTISI
ncbi:MAG: hypothetical protein HY303_04665 [Candidatus Wallbacteria bacterium]|nr:hypothetical protein [Candidatus Wallbacteria bacterium]